MSLKDQLKEDMKAAMKAREEGKTALSVIRMVNSAIKNTEINDKLTSVKGQCICRSMMNHFSGRKPTKEQV